MIEEFQKLVDSYVTWLKDKTTLRAVDKEWVEITTPYLDRHNDYVQIYARRNNSDFVLTDDGYTMDDLEQSGCSLESPKRRSLLQTTLNGFGVQMNGNALEVRATSSSFSLRKHNLVQAMLAVNDLFYLATAHVSSLFLEDVTAWLDLRDVRYTPNVKFTGKSGFDHLFDFVIPKSKAQPERILRAITSPNRQDAERLAFSWIDTREVRPEDSKAFAVLNDTERAVSPDVLDALRSYEVEPVPWSQRESFKDRLAA
jgi:Domain of unknown function DUF1829/Domain of unknown function DUF1828